MGSIRQPQLPGGRRGVSRLSPLRWSIAARSAFIAGTVVLIALGLAGAALTVALYQSLLAGLDDAAARRVGDIAAGLAFDSVADLDAPLLDTDQRTVAVQILDPKGNVVARSVRAPTSPLYAAMPKRFQPRARCQPIGHQRRA